MSAVEIHRANEAVRCLENYGPMSAFQLRRRLKSKRGHGISVSSFNQLKTILLEEFPWCEKIEFDGTTKNWKVKMEKKPKKEAKKHT